jgi:hypothetical protein
MTAIPPGPQSFAALRQFVRRRPSAERCELCSADLTHDHEHMIDPSSRRLVCCCNACAILFSGGQSTRYRRVSRRVQFLSDFHMTDPQWEDLHIPINLAFFFHSSVAERVVALYPSPAGATESLLSLEAWRELAEANRFLEELEPDVEALLVNRLGQARDYYRAPIDECYRLVGLIRSNWHGLGGGAEVWETIGGFFNDLKRRCGTGGDQPHA